MINVFTIIHETIRSLLINIFGISNNLNFNNSILEIDWYQYASNQLIFYLVKVFLSKFITKVFD